MVEPSLRARLNGQFGGTCHLELLRIGTAATVSNPKREIVRH